MSSTNAGVSTASVPFAEGVNSKPARWLVISAFLAVYLIWGSTYLGIRIAIDSIPPFLMAGSRFVSAGLILYLAMRARGISRPSSVHWKSAFKVGALLLLVGNGGMTWAEQTVPTNLAALMIAGTPLWIILIDWLRPGGKCPHANVFVGLTIGVIGVAVILHGRDPIGRPVVDPRGALVIILSSVSWAAGSVYSRHAAKPESSLMTIAMQMIAGGLLLLLASVGAGELRTFDWAAMTARSVSAFVYLTVCGSLIGFTSYVWLLQVSTPAKVSTYAYINPMIAVLLGWTALGEALPRSVLLAGGLILAAVLLTTLKPQERSG